MSRDQRHRDNWALLYACEVAARSDSGVVVVFNLVGMPVVSSMLACTTDQCSVSMQVKEFLGAGARQWGFLVRGLHQVEPALKALNIPFYMTYGKAEDYLPQLMDDVGAALLICDFVPVRAA